LARLLNLHPAIRVTFEFRPLLGLNAHPSRHREVLRKNVLRRRIIETNLFLHWRVYHARAIIPRLVLAALDRVQSLYFLLRYVGLISGTARVTAETILAAYRSCFGRPSWVGDKLPEYVFRLDQLADEPNLALIMIHRDPRDVAASAIQMYRAGWSGGMLGARLSSPEGVAASWAEAARLLLKHRSRCHVVRYESLVADPAAELERLGRAIGVGAGHFPDQLIRRDRVGRGAKVLTIEELQTVERVAEAEMAALGYETGLRGSSE
jgi:hypothetical protein